MGKGNYQELIGEFDYERNRFGQGEGRKIVGLLANGKVVYGKAQEGLLESGVTYHFWGFWHEHPVYGPQFNFQHFVQCKPAGEVGTISYLQRVPGIGKRRAAKIWELWGPECLQVLKNEPETIAEKIPGLTVEVATAAAEAFKRIEHVERITIELTDLLVSRGLSQRLIPILILEFGAEAADAIRRNPWVLMKFKGVGFPTADKLAISLGMRADAIDRQGWCIWNALHKDTEGHIWYPVSFAAEALSKNLGGADTNLKAAVEWACQERILCSKIVNRRTWIAITEKAIAEAEVARFVHQAEMEACAEPPRWPAPEELEGLEEDQREEYRKATQGWIGILGGRPGTGKTFTLAAVIKAILARGNGRLEASAPTGKAAVRATEALGKQQVSIRVKTVHSTLRVESNNDGSWQFAHDEEHPLPCDYLFLDEGSMLDCPLGASWLAARPAGCHVLIVGDPDQLSPVGPGAVLRDLIAAGIPTGHLTKIRRNAGRIERVCKDIAETGTFEPSPKLDLENGENFVWIEQQQPDRQVESLKAFYDRVRSGSRWDAIQDVQVLTPLNDKTPVSRKVLNKVLQAHLNPSGERAGDNPFRVADKIICTQNGWPALDDDFKEWLRKNCPVVSDTLLYRVYRTPTGDLQVRKKDWSVYVANGELAIVQKVTPYLTTPRLTCPDRVVKVPRGRREEKEEKDEGESPTGCNWELGYVISIHKSQGSEWPIVVVMIDSHNNAQRLADRHLIYTAFSRGKVLGVVIGQKRVALDACKISKMWDRKTFLPLLIQELREKSVDKLWEMDLEEMLR